MIAMASGERVTVIPPAYLEYSAHETLEGGYTPHSLDVELKRTPVTAGASNWMGKVRTEEVRLVNERSALLNFNWARKNLVDAKDRITPEETWNLVSRISRMEGGIVEGNLGLVYNFVGRTARRFPYLDWDELESEGGLALLESVRIFDPDKGNKFSTYASWAIRHRISHVIKTGTQRLYRFFNADSEYFSGLSAENAQAPRTGKDIADIEKIKLAMSESLDRVELDILQRRFPLNGEKRQTLREIGRIYRAAPETIRKTQNQALKKLRLSIDRIIEQAAA